MAFFRHELFVSFNVTNLNNCDLTEIPSATPQRCYGLEDRGSRVRFPVGAGNFFPHHRVQNDSGARPASYPMGTRDSFLGGKAAGA
jgi:hypothetical protein